MERTELNQLLAEIRTAREKTLAALPAVTEDDFDTAVPNPRFDDVRRILLRFSEHMREHASQLEGIRVGIGKAPTPPQRMLAEAELVWGKVLAATVNLSDADLDTIPAEGGWSVRTLLAHLLKGEEGYLSTIQTGL